MGWRKILFIDRDGTLIEERHYLSDPDVEDFAHVNGLSVDEVDDAILISVATGQAVVSIDRAMPFTMSLWLFTVPAR